MDLSSEKIDCGYLNDNPEYSKIIVSYTGDIESEIEKLPYACVDIINNYLAIVHVKVDQIKNLMKDTTTITYYEFDEMFVLEDISSISTAFIPQVQSSDYLKLSGKGVVVAILDTGIDYLNEAFMDESGNTRIEYIYDRSLEVTDSNYKNLYNGGKFYTEEEINNAIKLHKEGGDPYSIVPSKDTNGHGTSVAGVVGGRYKYGVPESVAPNCKFIIVKLNESLSAKRWFNTTEVIYSESEIINGMEFLINKKLQDEDPIVIFMTLGSTDGSHTGNTLIEVYIDRITIEPGILVVTGTGNESSTNGHISGKLDKVNETKYVELVVGEDEKNIYFNLVAKKPNKMAINIISPAGQETGLLPILTDEFQSARFIFEGTNVVVSYYWPDEFSGDELIRIVLQNVKPGLWRFGLVGEYILDGQYYGWLPPNRILKEGTRFLSSDQYYTMTIPGMADNIIVSAWYNEKNNTANIYSGRGEEGTGDFKYAMPLVAVGGKEVNTVGLDNKYVNITGSSAASAVMAGCCALLLEWGIINGNDKSMNSQKVKTYFMRGVRLRPGDVYPNPEWGYGKLDMLKLFQNIY